MTDEKDTRRAPDPTPPADPGAAPPPARDAGGERPAAPPPASPGPLLDPIAAERLEVEDRKRPIPGGEPSCPACGKKMVRRVERHPAPHGGESPFRVRLTCSEEACGAWTVYHW